MKVFRQLSLEDRIAIEKGIEKKKNFAEIAKEIRKDRSTVAREVKRHRIPTIGAASGARHFACEHARNPKGCKAVRVCGILCGKESCCRCPRGCDSRCPLFERYVCPNLKKAPYVCNTCAKRGVCAEDHFFYKASSANQEYRENLVDSRKGVTLTEGERKRIEEALKDGFSRGLSIHHIVVDYGGEPELGFSEKTLYNYVNNGVFKGIGRTDHPRREYKPRRKAPDRTYKVDKKCLEGRRYEDYLEFMENEGKDLSVVEIDTVEGRKDYPDKCLLTLHFTVCNFQLAIVRDRNTAATAIDAVQRLWYTLGPDDFKKLFPVILADNGSEFSDPEGIEFDRDLTWELRTRLFYCHPNASFEKGSCEVNHEYIRRIIPKGTELRITQAQANLMMSHINSSPRAKFGNRTPYEMFRFLYGADVLRSLRITYIPPKEVCLTPDLLK